MRPARERELVHVNENAEPSRGHARALCDGMSVIYKIQPVKTTTTKKQFFFKNHDGSETSLFGIFCECEMNKNALEFFF